MDIQSSPANENQSPVDQIIVPNTSRLAIVSLGLGIIGIAGVTGFVAIILGHLAFHQIKKSEGRLAGRGLAIGGLVTGYVSVILLVVSVVIYSLDSVSCPVPKTKMVDFEFRSLESALAMYRLNAGAYPTTEQGLDALVEKPTVAPLPRRWSAVMSKLNPDPWGNPYQYRFPSRENSAEPELSSKGPDGIAGTKDDLINETD